MSNLRICFVAGIILALVGFSGPIAHRCFAACQAICCYEGICHTSDGLDCLWTNTAMCIPGTARATAGLKDNFKCAISSGMVATYDCTLGSSCWATGATVAQGLNCVRGDYKEDVEKRLCTDACS